MFNLFNRNNTPSPTIQELRLQWKVAKLQREVTHLNRALARRAHARRKASFLYRELVKAAIELRLAQRNYMQAKADPGMGAEDVEHMGRNVGTAAAKLDLLLPPYTAADKIMSHQEHRKITITGKLSAKELLDAIHGSGGHG